MLKTSERLLRLLGLLQSGREWSAPELAARLSIEPRTVRRDVERLRTLGYPVNARRGVRGGYRLGERGSLPPLLLDSEEALAVAVGLRSAAVGSVTGAGEAAERALAKLEQVLPSALRAQLASMDAGLVTLPSGSSPVSGTDIATILEACDASVRLRFAYRSGTGADSDRDIEPFRLVQAGRHWYLVAFDLGRDEWRTFRVDRMTKIHTSTFGFRPRDPGEDAATLVSRAISTAPYRFQARVLVDMSPDRLTELVPPTVGMVLASDASPDRSRSMLLTGSDSLSALALHLASLGCNLQILGPPELIAAFGALGARLTAAFQNSHSDPDLESGPFRRQLGGVGAADHPHRSGGRPRQPE